MLIRPELTCGNLVLDLRTTESIKIFCKLPWNFKMGAPKLTARNTIQNRLIRNRNRENSNLEVFTVYIQLQSEPEIIILLVM